LKFKYLLIAFSIIITVIILVTLFVPMLTAGPDFIINFRQLTLPLLLFMFLLLGGVSIFFFYNYRLLSLLEREDWPALAYYLEQKIYIKRRYNYRNVRLLASSYLVITDYASVLKLEGKAILAKPSVVEKNILVFGAARVLSGNRPEAAAFFKTFIDKSKNKKCQIKENDKQWLRWFYGFIQLLAGTFKMAEPEFKSLAVSAKDAFITGLSAYFLNNTIIKNCENHVECLAAAQSGKERVIKLFKKKENWQKEVNKSGGEIHIAIIRKYIDEAGTWLFSEMSQNGDGSPPANK